MILKRILLLAAMAAAPFGLLYAQGSYEIQVYGSDLVDPGATMFEFHSNFTFEGSKTVVDGMYPTEHQLHETLEITHGFNDWFELGFYVFTSADSRVGWQWVGDHIRPRVAFRNRGIGRSASACPLKLAISGQFILQIPGPSRSGRSSIRRSADCICVSIPPSTARSTGRRFQRASHSHPT
jgi:hypothetical protein